LTQSPTRISVCIVCRNEADRLPECLESARWADEVIVMDLSSDDGSPDVAARHGARVVTHAPVPIVELVRNKVAAEASGDWIVPLDPDERITPGLAGELRKISARADVDAVLVPLMNKDFGYEPKTRLHRYDPKIRMYRRQKVRWPTEPNELPKVAKDRLHRIPPRDDLVLVHERNRTIAEALERVIRYAPAEAEAMLAAGETFTARKMVRRVSGKFYKQFVQGRAYEEGVPGVLRAFVLASFHLYVWACFWQLSGARQTPEDDRYLRRLGRPLRLLEAATISGRARRRAGKLWRRRART
jgi:glycosyltransferase involved in cell wall biosynthesis